MISIGGSTLAGLAQWLVLRRRGVRASRWLAFWLVGVVVGVGVAVAAIIGLESVAGGLMARLPTGLAARAVPWGLMLLMLGSITGAVAGAISARALSASLATATANHE